MNPRRWTSLLALAVAGSLLAGCGGGDDDESRAAQTTVPTTMAPSVATELLASDGSSVGRVTFTEVGGRVTVEARLVNLSPGFHGFHVHAVGKCERPAFTTAGGHLSVGEQAHSSHAGDQPVVLVMSDRTAQTTFTTDRYRLSDLTVPEGRAVIVHALADNYANIPTRYVREPDAATKSTGDAGDRVACGVIAGTPGAVTTSSTAVAAGGSTTSTRAGGSTTSTRAGATTTAVAAATLDCKTVAFTPNSEDAASSIRATGLTCADAEAFVRIAGARTSSGGPAQLDVEGYHCVRVRSVTDPLPQAFYECTNGAKKVTFTRS